MIRSSSVALRQTRLRGYATKRARSSLLRAIAAFDLSLLLATVLLCAFGVVMIHSATLYRQQQLDLDPGAFAERQIVFAALGVVALILLAWVDYRRLRTAAPLVYVGCLFLLALVLSPLGEIERGAARWIEMGPFQMQPSEPAKLGLLLVVAALAASARGRFSWRHLIVALSLLALPATLVFLQPDLGTTMILGALFAGALLVGGARALHFLALGALLSFGTAAALRLGLLADYQLQRITSFLDPTPAASTHSYNVIQSKIAIGSGGLHGTGLGAANSQTALAFVPEQPTDFIFTAVGEQLGFVGSAILLVLFATVIWRALRIAATAADLFASVVAAGIASMWAFQLFVNVGMTMGIMPITGIPLPFISYGGSSLITNLAAVGLLLGIHRRRSS